MVRRVWIGRVVDLVHLVACQRENLLTWMFPSSYVEKGVRYTLRWFSVTHVEVCLEK